MYKNLIKIITLFIIMIFNLNLKSTKPNSNHETTYLAGGCIWGMEEMFKKFDGVIATEVGYMGGITKNPNYDTVSLGITGHAETLKIIFDKDKTTFEKIFKYFLAIHDPTQLNRQQNDIGTQYRSALFFTNNQQKEIADNIIKKAEDLKIFNDKIKTTIQKAGEFYKAEEYHQDYIDKNPNGYSCHYYRPEWNF